MYPIHAFRTPLPLFLLLLKMLLVVLMKRLFFISCFTVSVTPSINTHKSFADLMILIISLISSLEISYQEPKVSNDWIILDTWALLNLIYVNILLSKAFLILTVCLVVRNNSSEISSSFKVFLIYSLYCSCLIFLLGILVFLIVHLLV